MDWSCSNAERYGEGTSKGIGHVLTSVMSVHRLWFARWSKKDTSKMGQSNDSIFYYIHMHTCNRIHKQQIPSQQISVYVEHEIMLQAIHWDKPELGLTRLCKW